MNPSHHKCIIIGSGLSGLVTAYELTKNGHSDFIILEGRDRIGGRICTNEGIDLGATWFQDHHSALSELIDELGVHRFRQFNKGRSIFIYSSMAPAQYFENDPNTPSAFRIGGGSVALIEALRSKVANKILTGKAVLNISLKQDGLISIETSSGTYTCDSVVLAMPPQLVTGIIITPSLSEDIQHALTYTHTWMSNAIKVGINYKKPFWRDKNLSGMMISHISPVIELYDHSDIEDQSYSLMGFVNEGLRDETTENRKKRILTYLSKHLGEKVYQYEKYSEKDWSQDQFTSSEKLKSIYISPSYDNPIWETSIWEDKLILAGAETSTVHGGYMDGAVLSGKTAAQRILKKFI